MNKKNKEKVKKYKRKLLLESIFPIFSGRTHSIPDVVGPLKLALHFGIALSLGLVISSTIPMSAAIIALQTIGISLSTIMTYGLYKTDYDKKYVDSLINSDNTGLDENDDIIDTTEYVKEDDNALVSKNTFNYENNSFKYNYAEKAKVLVKRR